MAAREAHDAANTDVFARSATRRATVPLATHARSICRQTLALFLRSPHHADIRQPAARRVVLRGDRQRYDPPCTARRRDRCRRVRDRRGPHGPVGRAQPRRARPFGYRARSVAGRMGRERAQRRPADRRLRMRYRHFRSLHAGRRREADLGHGARNAVAGEVAHRAARHRLRARARLPDRREHRARRRFAQALARRGREALRLRPVPFRRSRRARRLRAVGALSRRPVRPRRRPTPACASTRKAA